jgi:hypothetical protein
MIWTYLKNLVVRRGYRRATEKHKDSEARREMGPLVGEDLTSVSHLHRIARGGNGEPSEGAYRDTLHKEVGFPRGGSLWGCDAVHAPLSCTR